MESKTITIIIKEFEQDWKRYFLARSLDVPWLIVETDTIVEMMETVRNIADDLIASNNHYQKELDLNREPIKDYAYQIIFQPIKHTSLQLV